MKRVLAFFGAFNPPTLAHIALAEKAVRDSGREGVVFVPSKQSYITDKQKKNFAFDDALRLRMLRLLAESRPWMEVSDMELKSPVQLRTYETLCRLRDEAGYAPSLLVGTDKLAEMDTAWRYVDEILDDFGLVCLQRSGDDARDIIARSARLKEKQARIAIVSTPENLQTISSTAVREKLGEMAALREALTKMVPEEIINEIQYAYTNQTGEGK